MCTRYYYDNSIKELQDYAEEAINSPIGQKFVREYGKPVVISGEIRPTDISPVLAPNKDGQMTVYAMKWGFTIPLPHPSNSSKGTLIVNARVETAAEKVSFKESWNKRRCIIPAAYYYEWNHVVKDGKNFATKEKYMIQPRNTDITYLAGLYRIEDAYPVFTVLTTAPTAELSVIHDRMPIILPKERIKEWVYPTTNPDMILQDAIKDFYLEKVSSE